ncbi:type II secretion system F family protein [Alkalicoccus daliensis]|uniref:Competence protein ComGB n=1 Tax=Alkalicoccus daliensis TaxID=745820 RepID=A0A1H0B7W2_9BACI|nr:type II secretion system F family protein [Alkalicoccus daliensis]SDN41413.1 competence protein ComGB [Alkalicoccus daliensis]
MKIRLFKNDYERGKLLVELSSLLQDGYHIDEAIELYSTFLTGERRAWLLQAYEEMEQGEMFADQLKEAGFSNETISFIRMMELYGSFQKALDQSGYLLLKRHELKKQLQTVLHYPLILLAGVFLLGIVLLEGILPQFEQFFTSMQHELPGITKFMLFFTEWVRLPLFLAGIFIFAALFLWVRRKPVSEQVNLLLKIPLIHLYVRQLITYYFTAQLAPMLKGGLSLQQALLTMEKESMILFFQLEAEFFLKQLEEGEKFSEVLYLRPHFIPQLSVVWSFGETKGQTAQELETFAAYLFQQMYDYSAKAIRLIQPVVFCLIGGVVLILFFSMMLPVFSIIDTFN